MSFSKLLKIICRNISCNSDCGGKDKYDNSNSSSEEKPIKKKKYNKRDSVVDEIEMVLDD